MLSTIGIDDARMGDFTWMLLPVENAMKISPEESNPIPPALARPTVARLASRCYQPLLMASVPRTVWEEEEHQFQQ